MTQKEVQEFKKKSKKNPRLLNKYKNNKLKALRNELGLLLNQISSLRKQSEQLILNLKNFESLRNQYKQELIDSGKNEDETRDAIKDWENKNNFNIKNSNNVIERNLERIKNLEQRVEIIKENIVTESAKKYHENENKNSTAFNLLLNILLPGIFFTIEKVFRLLGIDLTKYIKRGLVFVFIFLIFCCLTILLLILVVTNSLFSGVNTTQNIQFLAENGLGESLFESYKCSSLDSFNGRNSSINTCEN